MYKHRHLIKFALIIIFLTITAVMAYIICKDYSKSGITPNTSKTGAPSPSFLPSPSPVEDSADHTEEEIVTEPQKRIRQEFLDLRYKYSNDDIIGCIKIEGTSIDYPVVQYSDNEYYLERNIYKEPDTAGWIFLDYENNIDPFNTNTIIYGHNMKKDIMFHAIRYYQNEDFYKEHRYIVFNTLYEDTVWEIFSFMKTHVSLNYLQVQPSDKVFERLLNTIKSQSMYDTGVEVSVNDKILNLSTCSVDPNESMYRYVLTAKLVGIQKATD